MGKINKTLAEEIRGDCISWLEQHDQYSSEGIRRRKKSGLSYKAVIKLLLGFFTRLKLNDSKNLFIFQGIRNKSYIEALDPKSIVILGSHYEKRYAKLHGFSYLPSFPIESAVQAKVYRNWNFPINWQVGVWRSELANKKVTFFLYEDTQFIGTFIANLSFSMPSNITCVCIQHGYFSRMEPPVRPDGCISEVNFVWDQKQIGLLGLDPVKSFVIGLPYIARAKIDDAKEKMTVVLVGTGSLFTNKRKFSDDLDLFRGIREILEDGGYTVLYRPHPVELSNFSAMQEVNLSFHKLDELPVSQRLNGGKSIFIGTKSSFLYEAKAAEHIVVHINVDDGVQPVFKHDLELDADKVDQLLGCLQSIRVAAPSDLLLAPFDMPEDPQVAFMHAINSANLID